MELSWRNRGTESEGGVAMMNHQASGVAPGVISSATNAGAYSQPLLRRRVSPTELVSGNHYRSNVPAAVASHPHGGLSSSPFTSPAGSPSLSSPLPGSPLQSRTISQTAGMSEGSASTQQSQRLYMQSLHNQRQKHGAAMAQQSQVGIKSSQHINFNC